MDHFGAMVDGNIKLSDFFFEVIEAVEAAEVIETTDMLRPGK